MLLHQLGYNFFDIEFTYEKQNKLPTMMQFNDNKTM